MEAEGFVGQDEGISISKRVEVLVVDEAHVTQSC